MLRTLSISILVTLSTALGYAQPAETSNKWFHASQSTLLAATFTDAWSSRGGVELNPMAGRGDFKLYRQGALALGITAGYVFLVERPIAKRWPKSKKAFTILNFVVAGEHVGAATFNWRQ